MNKNAELAILDEAIAKLGRNSYLGPWLADVRGHVERDIRSDLPVSATLSESQAFAAGIVSDAQKYAAEIRARAEKDVARARADVVSMQDRARTLREAMTKAKEDLNNIILTTY